MKKLLLILGLSIYFFINAQDLLTYQNRKQWIHDSFRPVSTDTTVFSLYHIGNSLTGDLWSGFKGLASAHLNPDNTYKWGAHYRSATSMTFMYQNPDDTIKTTSVTGLNTSYSQHPNKPDQTGFEPWNISLPNHHWDAVTLQPAPSGNFTLAEDVKAANGFISSARTNNPPGISNKSTRFFIYATWGDLVKDTNDPTGYRPFKDDFLKTTPNPTDPNRLSTRTREYYNTLSNSVRTTNPDVSMIPVAEVFLVLDSMIRAGLISGYTSLAPLYRDVIHLSPSGQDIAGYTAYAVIFHQSPVGLKGKSEILQGQALQIVQQTVWDVVNELSYYTHVLPGERIRGG